jgi:ProP effector
MANQKRLSDTQFSEVHRNIDLCNTLFPLAFPKRVSGVDLKPLKIGINQDLFIALNEAGHPVSSKAIRRMLGHWCSRPFYLKAFNKAQERIDLQGNPVAPLTEEEKLIAKTQFLSRTAQLAIKAEKRADLIAEAAENALLAE